jgi:hypothetical protein
VNIILPVKVRKALAVLEMLLLQVCEVFLRGDIFRVRIRNKHTRFLPFDVCQILLASFSRSSWLEQKLPEEIANKKLMMFFVLFMKISTEKT